MSLPTAIWGENLDIPGFRVEDDETVWIVVPGQRRRSLVRRAIAAAGDRFRVMVQGALDRRLGGRLGLRGRSLSEPQSHALLASILERNADELRALRELVPATRSHEHVVPGVAVRLREMLDFLRLHESEHLLLERSADDETGEILEERAPTFELHQVLEEYEQRLDLEGWEDPISLRRRLADALDASARPDALPSVLVLDQPSYLYPLEQRFWTALARLTRVHLVVDASVDALVQRIAARSEGIDQTDADSSPLDRLRSCHGLDPGTNGGINVAKLPPSERHIGPLAAWLFESRRRFDGVHALSDRSPASGAIGRAMFDGLVPEAANSESIVLWREHDRRREVERLVRTVKWGILHGHYRPEHVHVAAPYLDPYLPLLRRAFADAGVPCSLPKGDPLWSSAPATVLRAALRWIGSGTSEDMLGFLGGRAVRRPRLDEVHARSFCNRFARWLPPVPAQLLADGTESWAQLLAARPARLQPFRLDNEARRARVPGGPDFAGDWVAPMLAHVASRLAAPDCSSREAARLVRIVADLAALEMFWMRLHPLASPSIDPVDGLDLLRRVLRKGDAISRLVRQGNLAKPRHPREGGDPGEPRPPLDPHHHWMPAFAGMTQVGATHANAEMADTSSVRPEPVPNGAFALKAQTNEGRGSEMAQASRALGAIARLWREVDELVRFRRDDLGIEDRGFTAVRNFLLEALRSTHLARAPQADAVVATELLDTRTERFEVVFVLGLAQADFPPRELENYLLPDGLPASLAKPLDRAQEAIWLFGRLLRNGTRVILSCPRYSEDGLVQPATALEDLARWSRQGRVGLAELPLPPSSWVATFDELARRSPFDERLPPSLAAAIRAGVAALDARKQPQFTAYDGSIGAHPLLQQETRQYSVTALDTFVVCPHHYFFQKVLDLETITSIPSDLEQNRTGTLVHQALDRFFRVGGPWHGREVLAENFDQACAAMLETARGVLRDGEIDWDSSPILQAQRIEILRGLDEPGDCGKRGYLKAALAFQRDFIRSVPTYCEMMFGHGSAPPLRLLGGVQIRGTIDRVDLHGDELRVWDYKTGAVPRPTEGGSLQIPLYAEAALRALADAGRPEGLHVRGGYVALTRRNQRQNMDHPIDGGLVEALAIDRVGNRWIPAPGAVAGRIEAALSRVEDIDSKIRGGRFHQVEETPEPVCARCNYQGICERDVPRLWDKLQFIESPSGPTPDPVPTLVHRKPSTKDAPLTGLRQAQGEGAKQARALTDEQELASDIERTVVLTAGAGSGKTFVLMTRVCRLVASGTPIESILAITFTRKAAEEVRNRIGVALGEAIERGDLDGKPLDEGQRRALVDARAVLPGATVTTIHGLCQQILRMDPVLSGADDRARVLEEVHLTELQGIAVDAVLAGGGPRQEKVLRILTSSVSLRDLRRGLKELIADQNRLHAIERSLSSRSDSQWRDALARLHQLHVERVGQALETRLAEWLSAFEAWSLLPDRFGNKPGVDLEEREHRYLELASRVRDLLDDVELRGWGAQVQHVAELAEILDVHRRCQVRASGDRRNLWKELREHIEELNRVGIWLAFEREQEGLELARDICALAVLALEHYLALKLEHAAIDYDDQLARAHRMLCIPAQDARLRVRQGAVTRRLRRRYRHILVDEFQDTDARQWEILRTLVGEQTLDAGMTVFLVGDRKQAIYGFRGGENRVFEEARRVLTAKGATPASLLDNYRSHPHLIHFVNTVFDPLFSSEFKDGNPALARWVQTAVPPEPMRPARTIPGRGGTVSILGLRYAGRGEQKTREAALVAKLVRAALSGQMHPFTDLAGDPEDQPRIGILCRRVSDLLRLARALDREGVHYAISHGSGFFRLPEVRALENLLLALADERNGTAMAGVLRGPLFGLTDRDLADARYDLGQYWVDAIRRGEWDDPRGRRIHRDFTRWRRMATVSTTSALLAGVVAESGIAASFEAIGSPGAASNIEKLIDLVYREERTLGRSGLVELIRWFELQRNASEGAAVPPGRRTPVALMTVHGAKGLEFPMVVLPFLERWSRTDQDFVISDVPDFDDPILGIQVEDARSSYRRRPTFLSQLAADEQSRRGASELKRLFYVACTRARRHLVLGMNESADFWSEQRRRDALGVDARREALVRGRDPKAWLSLLLRIPGSSGVPPGELVLPGEDPIRIPMIWPESIPEPPAAVPDEQEPGRLDTTGLA